MTSRHTVGDGARRQALWQRGTVTAACWLLLLGQACATLQQGNRQVVRVGFFGGPPVHVTADSTVCGAHGIAPVDCDVARRRTHLIQAKGGGVDTTVTVTPHLNWYWVRKDLLTLGLGWIVDAMTGAWYDLSPDTIEHSRAPTAPASPRPTTR